MRNSKFLKFFATCTFIPFPSPVMAFSNSFETAPALNLFPRASCAVAGYTTCGQGLPSDFCCPADTTCKAFNGGASAICCPAGQDCSTILPITCDISQMNVTQFPTAPIHSTQLTGTLSGCGAQCCPLGYSCQNQQCILGTDAAHASSTTSLASSPRTTTSAISSSVTSTATVSATSPSVVPALSSSLPVSSAHCKLFPGSAVAAGFFPGVALGALLAVLSTICFARRRDAKLANEEEDKPRVNPIVSEPIYHGESMATRTDFLRRASKSLYSPHVKSLFNRSPTFVQRDSPDGIGRSLKSPNTPPRTPRTPESRIGLRHEPSMESIKIYSPPDGRVGRGTTFTDLMANAGFRHDDAFLSGRLNRDSVTTRNLT